MQTHDKNIHVGLSLSPISCVQPHLQSQYIQESQQMGKHNSTEKIAIPFITTLAVDCNESTLQSLNESQMKH